MPELPFTTRENSILEFVLRYRLATNRALAAGPLKGRSTNAVSKVTARMCSSALLVRYPLIPPESYFRLGKRAIASLGVTQQATQPLGPQSLPTEYAVMLYAIQADACRRRLTAKELREYLPWLTDDLARAPYCLDAMGRLDLIRVDLGGSPQRVARKVVASLHQRIVVPEFADLASQQRMRVAIITGVREKATAIAATLSRLDEVPPIRIHFAVIPRLTNLLLRTT